MQLTPSSFILPLSFSLYTAAAVRRADELLFLKEIIPLPIPLAQAVTKRKAKEDGADIEEVIGVKAPTTSFNNNNAPSTSTLSFPTTNPPSTSATFTPAPTGALDNFIERKPSTRKMRPSRNSSASTAAGAAASSNAPDGLVNGQHTFAVDPSVIERERHPSYFGDFAVPITPATVQAAQAQAPPRSSGRQSVPSARRAAQNTEDAMDTT